MDTNLQHAIRDRDERAIENLFFNNACPSFFAVDWRDDDQAIVQYCANCLDLDSLNAEWNDDTLAIVRDGHKTTVPHKSDDGDRHVTLCTLNYVLLPDFEIRMLVCSHGSDTAGFCVLSTSDWDELDRQYAETTDENFLRLSSLPNIFTELTDDKLPQSAQARMQRMIERNRIQLDSQSIANNKTCRTIPSARLARFSKWLRSWFGLGVG